MYSLTSLHFDMLQQPTRSCSYTSLDLMVRFCQEHDAHLSFAGFAPVWFSLYIPSLI